jgi:hypothetical protein
MNAVDSASTEKQQEKKKHVTIVVGGQPKEWDKEQISFDQVVKLAYPDVSPDDNKVFYVNYEKGPKQNREGMMDPGSKVHVQEGMEFIVERGDKS